ncbi:MAG: rod shape determining protein RodA [Gammaproteobacteria bacterium]|jgi:rod shape determining protein RodA
MNNMSDTGDSSRLRRLLDALNIDPVLFTLLMILSAFGIVLLYSGSGASTDLIVRQLTRLSLGLFLFILVANIPLRALKSLSVWLYLFGVLLLLAVMFFGEVGKGAQRWLDLGIIRFQPSEMLKLAVPLMVASYLSDRVLPIGLKDLFVSVILVLIPVMLIARQPDLGTAILVGSAGAFVLFLAGVRWRIMLSLMFLFSLMAPLLWKFSLHDYQRSRILTMFDPESDPLGSGYHIIQSKIAIGSGGVYGKGWLNGTQSQFDFIPERSTDFIFSVFGEEFGFLGGVILILLYLSIIFRGLYIAARSNDSYGQLVAGAISLTFFVYLFVNIGMVSGMLPVVGVPLPLISYGGTSMVTLLVGFGLIMSIRSTKRFMG